MDTEFSGHRPRDVGWIRAASILYGDWGTSKAYVTGLAFSVAAFASLPIILAVCVVTGLVGINYAVICRHFPDGGGVYSAAREQSRMLAVIGALLLVAGFTVTSALSCRSGLSYLSSETAPTFLNSIKDHIAIFTAITIALIGWVNWYGPKHSGSLAVILSLPVVVIVLALLVFSVPHLTTKYLQAPHHDYGHLWVQFTGVILALSGVEAVANMTGVMKLDPGSTYEKPKVGKTSGITIFIVAFEVVFGTALLGWAMLSIPSSHKAILMAHQENMLRYVAEYFGALTFTPLFGIVFGWITGILFCLLLISAANTATVAMIGLFYMLARDGEMPASFAKLNRNGVPIIPLLITVALPVIVVFACSNFEALAGLYAIGVVGAIAVNVGSCMFNNKAGFTWYERVMFALTFVILFAVEVTIGATQDAALKFVICVVGIGLALRAWSQKRSGITTVTMKKEVAALVNQEMVTSFRPELKEGQKIMVAVRGVTPVLRYAMEEAQLRKATLCVVYVKEIAVFLPSGTFGKKKWQDDPHAASIMTLMLNLGKEKGVSVAPVYAASPNPANAILDLAATLGIDYLLLGSSHRHSLARLLKGNVVEKVALGLPEDIHLVIYG